MVAVAIRDKRKHSAPGPTNQIFRRGQQHRLGSLNMARSLRSTLNQVTELGMGKPDILLIVSASTMRWVFSAR